MHQDERMGVLFAILGYVLLSMGDSVWKLVADAWAPTALATWRYSLGAVGLGAALWWREGALGFRVRNPWVQLMRGSGVAIATASFVTAVGMMPLVDTTAILFTSPLLTALLAAVFLKEPVTRQTWLANLGGFVGVAIVLRPNLMALGPVAILPLVSALGMSMLVIGNRLSAGSGSALAMQFQLAAPAAFFLALIALAGHLSGVETLHVGAPQGVAIFAGVVVAIVATAGHWCIYFGTTRAGAATIAPMTYVQIVCAGVLGWLLFGDVPDLLALVGVAIIVASGLFLWRGRQPVGVPDEAG